MLYILFIAPVLACTEGLDDKIDVKLSLSIEKILVSLRYDFLETIEIC